MYLELNWTDPTTGAQYPSAALAIEDVQCHQATNHGQLDVAIYADASAAQPASQKGPVFRDSQLILTPAEIARLWGAFQSELYAILQERREYTGAQLVA